MTFPETLRETFRGDEPEAVRWPWRIGFVLENPDLEAQLSQVASEIRAECAFRTSSAAPAFEVASLVERERPDLLFAELGCVAGSAAEWMQTVRGGGDSPLIVAVHPNSDPAAMLDAMRAGAVEFLSLPARPGVFEALDRVATLLESRKAAAHERGKMAGVLSAKGGCGATTIACHLAAALRPPDESGRVLVADLDTQSPAVHRLLRTQPRLRVHDAFESVRRLNAACWQEFAVPAADRLDMLGGWKPDDCLPAELPEPWRIESLFRFLTRNYTWTLADLGRHLNPAVWSFLQNLDELYIVTAPDVLALYQTRSVLQTLSGRGFDKSRLRLILNRNKLGPQDFWVESIEQMFEMSVTAVIPDDAPTFERTPRDRYEFPGATPFGRSIAKLAGRLGKPSVKKNVS